ncbi:MAG: NAD(P)H-dependent oxidoreductase subunit E, partial [Bacteroidota bacterium]
YGFIPEEAINEIEKKLEISTVDIEQTISFYHFFSVKPRGKYVVYLNNSVVAGFMGRAEVAKAFEEAAGCGFGETTTDGLIGLYDTACIGMNDQEPAALINGVPFTNLTIDKAKELIAGFRAGKEVYEFVSPLGDGANNSQYLKSMVNNNLKKKGAVLFTEYTSGTALRKLTEMTPEQVINEVKASNIRGRGGAGFPTGMKWEFCTKFKAKDRYVVCNADEGEPGTFKDRVILTELPHLVFEGMTIGGYAIGAKEGILYLRNEYKYLQSHLENTLDSLRSKNLLGINIAGKAGFDFDIRIQFGAGAYVCGEESALIESAEGKRGEPRNRPPFPVQCGYMDQPTIVNNVETLSSVVKIIEKGGDWYKAMGTKNSSGTKLLSISGDCKNPGVYEIEWGISVNQMLEMVGAENTMAVQVAGPSGVCLQPSQFDRIIAIEDLPTGGAMIVIGKNRNLLKDVVLNFTEFFVDESCGSCSTCRALNVLLKNKLEKIIDGNGIKSDIEDLEKWSVVLSKSARCGLGQTSSNPIATTIKNFRDKYEALVKDTEYFSEFDMAASVKDSCEYVGRTPNIH